MENQTGNSQIYRCISNCKAYKLIYETFDLTIKINKRLPWKKKNFLLTPWLRELYWISQIFKSHVDICTKLKKTGCCLLMLSQTEKKVGDFSVSKHLMNRKRFHSLYSTHQSHVGANKKIENWWVIYISAFLDSLNSRFCLLYFVFWVQKSSFLLSLRQSTSLFLDFFYLHPFLLLFAMISRSCLSFYTLHSSCKYLFRKAN